MLVVGAVYTSSAADSILNVRHGKVRFVTALKNCVQEHPILSTVITDGATETPGFATTTILDLEKHIEIREFVDSSEDVSIEKALAQVSDEQFSSVESIPPWKVVLVPLPREDHSGNSRLLALFAYYHSHGDGKSGLAFHRSFFRGLNMSPSEDNVPTKFSCEAPETALLPPIEQAGKLSLSWSFLLSPLLGAYLPSFLARMFGFRASYTTQDDDIWRGHDLTFDADNFCTGLVLRTIEHGTMRRVLQSCKARQATFTGVFNQIIARSLSAALGASSSANGFASQIVVDMRQLFGGIFNEDSMTNCVTAYNETIADQDLTQQSDWATNPSSPFWAAARKTSAGLADTAGTLHNQPIGLLQYLNAFRPWTLEQIGKKREISYEISNLVVFDPKGSKQPEPSGENSIAIEKTIFSQPANAAGALLNFNLVSTKGGPLVMTVTWQLGVLDLLEGPENAFVQEVCENIKAKLQELAHVGV